MKRRTSECSFPRAFPAAVMRVVLSSFVGGRNGRRSPYPWRNSRRAIPFHPLSVLSILFRVQSSPLLFPIPTNSSLNPLIQTKFIHPPLSSGKAWKFLNSSPSINKISNFALRIANILLHFPLTHVLRISRSSRSVFLPSVQVSHSFS